eukprot:654569-Prorocentrum_minimum.AAC.1
MALWDACSCNRQQIIAQDVAHEGAVTSEQLYAAVQVACAKGPCQLPVYANSDNGRTHDRKMQTGQSRTSPRKPKSKTSTTANFRCNRNFKMLKGICSEVVSLLCVDKKPVEEQSAILLCCAGKLNWEVFMACVASAIDGETPLHDRLGPHNDHLAGAVGPSRTVDEQVSDEDQDEDASYLNSQQQY